MVLDPAIIDEYRRVEREQARRSPLPDLTPEPADPAPDDEQAGVLGELANCMRPLLDELSPEQRRAVELTELEGMSQAARGADGLHPAPRMPLRLTGHRRSDRR